MADLYRYIAPVRGIVSIIGGSRAGAWFISCERRAAVSPTAEPPPCITPFIAPTSPLDVVRQFCGVPLQAGMGNRVRALVGDMSEEEAADLARRWGELTLLEVLTPYPLLSVARIVRATKTRAPDEIDQVTRTCGRNNRPTRKSSARPGPRRPQCSVRREWFGLFVAQPDDILGLRILTHARVSRPDRPIEWWRPLWAVPVPPELRGRRRLEDNFEQPDDFGRDSRRES